MAEANIVIARRLQIDHAATIHDILTVPAEVKRMMDKDWDVALWFVCGSRRAAHHFVASSVIGAVTRRFNAWNEPL